MLKPFVGLIRYQRLCLCRACLLDRKIQIPYQIDEITPEGSYFDDDDGILDYNDEIAFMAADLGDSVGTDSWLPEGSDRRYEVKISDPMNPSEMGWV